jgi:hypothetical protein
MKTGNLNDLSKGKLFKLLVQRGKGRNGHGKAARLNVYITSRGREVFVKQFKQNVILFGLFCSMNFSKVARHE